MSLPTRNRPLMAALLEPKIAYDVILEWSMDRPGWQRDALRRIVQQAALNDEDIAALAVLCKRGRQAAGAADGPAAVHLDSGHFPANPGVGQSVSLTAIKDVTSVNRLAPSETLSFSGRGVSLVYGDNGTGKSGYGRLLKRACRARHTEPILSDVYADAPAGPRRRRYATKSLASTSNLSNGGTRARPSRNLIPSCRQSASSTPIAGPSI